LVIQYNKFIIKYNKKQQQQNTLIADTITGNPVVYTVGYIKIISESLKNVNILKKLQQVLTQIIIV